MLEVYSPVMVTGPASGEWGKVKRKVMQDRRVAYSPATHDGDSIDGTYLMCRENAGYRFLLSVMVSDGEVSEIEVRTQNRFESFLTSRNPTFSNELPAGLGETVDDRIAFMEDPPEIIPFILDCEDCDYESDFVDITPKLDLRIDGASVRRVIEEYCPECGAPDTAEYELGEDYRLSSEMADLDPWSLEVPPKEVWEHSRLNH